VSNAKLADDSVSTAKIQNDAVTLPKAVFADQNLRQTDTPTFNQLTLSSPGTAASGAVRADRTIRLLPDPDSIVSWSPETAQNLTGDREFTPTLLEATTTQKGVLSTGTQAIGGDKTFHNDVKLTNDSDLISAAGFTHGFLGSGFRKNYDGTDWELELDRLWIRKSLFATEFIINQITAINGSDLLSAGAGKVEAVSGPTGGVYTITVSDASGNDISPFVAGDILRIQQVTPDAFSGGGEIVKSIELGVLNVSNNVIDAEIIGTPDGAVAVGDVLVVIGSTISGRQAAIYRTVIEDDSPFVRVMTGLSSSGDFANPANAVVQYGKLDNLSGTYSEVSGFGLFVKDRFYAKIGDTNTMSIGREAGGSGKHGVNIGTNDYWYGDKTFSFGGGIISGTASEARIARLEARSNRIYYQAKDPTEVPVANTFSGLAASDQDALAEFERPAFFAGAASDSIAHTRAAKIRLWPDGDAYFGGDVDLEGVLRLLTQGNYESLAVKQGSDPPGAVDKQWDESVDNFTVTDGSGESSDSVTALAVNEDLPMSVSFKVRRPDEIADDWRIIATVALLRDGTEVTSASTEVEPDGGADVEMELSAPIADDSEWSIEGSWEVDFLSTGTPMFFIDDIEFAQYKPKTVFNERGGFQRISPNITVPFGGAVAGRGKII